MALPFQGGPQIGGPAANPWAAPVGGVSPVGFPKPMPQVPQGEPPWVTRAREARKRAKAGAGAATPPPTSGPPESMPAPAPAPTEVTSPLPPPTGGYNPGPQPTPPGIPPPNMGGIPRGGIMGGRGIPRNPAPPKLQRVPGADNVINAPIPKTPRDPGDIYGKTPGGGF